MQNPKPGVSRSVKGAVVMAAFFNLVFYLIWENSIHGLLGWIVAFLCLTARYLDER